MAEIASLSLEVRSDQIKQATASLRELPSAASAAERAAKKWGMTTDAATRSTEDFSRRVQSTIRNLEFERAQLTRSSAEKAKYIALRRAGVSAASAEGAAITASTAALVAEQRALERRAVLMNRVRSAAFALGAALGTAIAVRQFFTATIEADAAQAQLAASLESTGSIAGQTIEALNEHAAALQKVTTFGDEAVNSAQALLLTFTQIRGDVFPKATEAVLNVATAMKTDLKSAAIQVGKALNDPILGVTALARSGIQFTQAQKDMIKSLVDSGQMVAAQTLILKELESQFGGSAKAARETLGGALKALQNAFGDLFEIGGAGSEGLRLAIEDLIKAISNPAFAKFIQTVGTLLFGAISLSSRGFGMMAAGIGQLVDGFIWLDDKVYKTANILIGSFVAAYEDIKAVWNNFPDILSAAFVGAVNAAVRGINAMVQIAADGIDKVIDLANRIPGVDIGKIGKVNTINEMDNPAAGRLAGAVDGRNAAVNAAMSRDYLGRSDNALMDALGGFNTGPGKGKGGVAAPLDAAATGGKDAAAALRETQKAMDDLFNSIEKIRQASESVMDKFGNGAAYAARETAALNEMLQLGFIDADTFGRAMQDVTSRADDQARAFRGAAGGLDGFLAGMEQSFAEMDRLNTAFALGQNVSKLLSESFTDLATTGELNFNKLLASFANMISQMLIQAAAASAIKALFSAFGGSGGGGGANGLADGIVNLTGSLLGFQHGAAFAHGNVIPFARGGVVSHPTLFPMANGAGLMGEAGPEGVLPLRRGPDGRLGVSAHGGGQGGDTITIYIDQTNNLGEFVTTSQFAAGLRQVERSAREGAKKGIIDARKRGGLKTVFS